MMYFLTAILYLQIWLTGVWSIENGGGEQYIIGGEKATSAQYPYQISMQLDGSHHCGGSIIEFDKILTAAHCVYGHKNTDFTIVAGIINLQETENRQTATIKEIIMHPDYNRNTLQNDIAVLRLNSILEKNSFVQKVELRENIVVPELETLTVTGWGAISHPRLSYPDDLQSLTVRSGDVVTCDLRLAVMKLPVTTRNVCTVRPAGQGACYGDSGGPLTDSNGKQVGVVSWGYPCAKDYPDVYASVNFFYQWINEN